MLEPRYTALKTSTLTITSSMLSAVHMSLWLGYSNFVISIPKGNPVDRINVRENNKLIKRMMKNIN